MHQPAIPDLKQTKADELIAMISSVSEKSAAAVSEIVNRIKSDHLDQSDLNTLCGLIVSAGDRTQNSGIASVSDALVAKYVSRETTTSALMERLNSQVPVPSLTAAIEIVNRIISDELKGPGLEKLFKQMGEATDVNSAMDLIYDRLARKYTPADTATDVLIKRLASYSWGNPLPSVTAAPEIVRRIITGAFKGPDLNMFFKEVVAVPDYNPGMALMYARLARHYAPKETAAKILMQMLGSYTKDKPAPSVAAATEIVRRIITGELRGQELDALIKAISAVSHFTPNPGIDLIYAGLARTYGLKKLLAAVTDFEGGNARSNIAAANEINRRRTEAKTNLTTSLIADQDSPAKAFEQIAGMPQDTENPGRDIIIKHQFRVMELSSLVGLITNNAEGQGLQAAATEIVRRMQSGELTGHALGALFKTLEEVRDTNPGIELIYAEPAKTYELATLERTIVNFKEGDAPHRTIAAANEIISRLPEKVIYKKGPSANEISDTFERIALIPGNSINPGKDIIIDHKFKTMGLDRLEALIKNHREGQDFQTERACRELHRRVAESDKVHVLLHAAVDRVVKAAKTKAIPGTDQLQEYMEQNSSRKSRR